MIGALRGSWSVTHKLGMGFRLMAFTLIAVCGAFAAPASESGVGEIVYEEGSVTIKRGERLLSGSEADIGSAILCYDLVATGAKSRVEIDLASDSSGGATIKLAERTIFYFDSVALDGGKRRTMLKLLAGSIALKVEKLGGGSFTVRSGNAVLGVRGTTFTVDSSPDNSILVSCVEGSVSCRDSEGREYSAEPGSLVESTASSGLGSRPLAPDRLLENRSTWLAAKEATIGREGAVIFLAAATELSRARPAFAKALAGLDSLAPSLAAWEAILASGKTLGPGERLEERKAIAGALLVCLKSLPSFERAYYRLADLSSRKAGGQALGGDPDSLLWLGSSLEDYASQAGADEAGLSRLRRALYVFSRLEADSPLGEFFAEKAAAL